MKKLMTYNIVVTRYCVEIINKIIESDNNPEIIVGDIYKQSNYKKELYDHILIKKKINNIWLEHSSELLTDRKFLK